MGSFDAAPSIGSDRPADQSKLCRHRERFAPHETYGRIFRSRGNSGSVRRAAVWSMKVRSGWNRSPLNRSSLKSTLPGDAEPESYPTSKPCYGSLPAWESSGRPSIITGLIGHRAYNIKVSTKLLRRSSVERPDARRFEHLWPTTLEYNLNFKIRPFQERKRVSQNRISKKSSR